MILFVCGCVCLRRRSLFVNCFRVILEYSFIWLVANVGARVFYDVSPTATLLLCELLGRESKELIIIHSASIKNTQLNPIFIESMASRFTNVKFFLKKMPVDVYPLAAITTMALSLGVGIIWHSHTASPDALASIKKRAPPEYFPEISQGKDNPPPTH